MLSIIRIITIKQMGETLKRRNSKPRELVRNILFSGRLFHPTADDVYAEIRKKKSNISLGTVYRNLNLLSQAGEIRKISGVGEQDRFDFHTKEHSHFKCTLCRTLTDIFITPRCYKKLADDGYMVISTNIVIEGICPKCAKKISKRKQKER